MNREERERGVADPSFEAAADKGGSDPPLA